MLKNILIVVVGVLALGAVLYAFGAFNGEEEQRNVEMLTDGNGVEVEAQYISYQEGVNGFYARPAAEGEYPGVVMIHEWWGLNSHIEDMARELASQGYHVLAVDLFGTVATTPDEARTQVGALDQEVAVANMRSAATYLRGQGAGEVASLGWCFGGGQSLQFALSDEPLAATVIYYGNLATSTEVLAAVDQPVLGIFGEEDTSISVGSVRAFEAALNSLDIENEVHVYPGVGHAFANPSGMNYAPGPTQDAWEKTLAFLQEHLK